MERTKNAIFSLQHIDTTIDSEEEILEHATHYYKMLPLTAQPHIWTQIVGPLRKL